MTRRSRLQIRSLELGTTQIPWTTTIAHAGFGIGRARRIILAYCGLLFSKISINKVRISKDDTSQIPENGETWIGIQRCDQLRSEG
jgi:hypothetical protein